MKVGSNQWNETITKGALDLGVTLDSSALAQITQHALYLVQWNRKINLTAITDPLEMAVKHYIDSIVLAKYITPSAGRPLKILDIGSGGGFPGMILKFIIPSLDITLIDASRKKVSFLNFIIRTLTLKDLNALHKRAEEYCLEVKNIFDVVVCRAFSKIDAFVDLSLPFLETQGKMIALKGGNVNEELPALELNPNIQLMDVSTFNLPILESKRSIVIVEKK